MSSELCMICVLNSTEYNETVTESWKTFNIAHCTIFVKEVVDPVMFINIVADATAVADEASEVDII